jgi:PAS domain S-box-containing protein
VASAATAATIALRVGLGGWLGDRPLLLLFVLPIFLSAYVGGLGPGLVATALAALGTSYFLIPPLHSLAMDRPLDVGQWLLLIVVGIVISTLTGVRLKQLQREAVSAPSRQNLLPERKVQAGFAFALTCLAVVGVVSFSSVTQLSEQADSTRHTEEVIAGLRLLLSSLTDLETGQRGYTITGDKSFLAPYASALQQIDAEFTELRKLTRDNAEQQRRLGRFAPLLAKRIAKAVEMVAVRREQGFDAAQAAIASGEGKALHDQVRASIAEMTDAELALLRQRERVARHAAALTRAVISGGSGLAIFCVAVALFVVGRDFAGSRRAEAALKDANEQLEVRVRERTAALAGSEARLGGIVASAMDGIVSVNSAQRIVLFNAAAERLFGWTAAAAFGQSLDLFIPLRFRESHRQHLRDFGAAGVNSRSAHAFRTLSALKADGTEIPIEASISQVEVAGETIFTVILRDISDRQRAERAASLLAALVESSSDAIVSKDLHSIVTSWNAGAERMFGYSAADMVGRSITVLIPPQNQAEEVEIVAKISHGERVENFETVRLRKDGAALPVSVSVSPIKDPSGRIVGASNVARDISERKRADDERKQLAQLIEHSRDFIAMGDLDGRISFMNSGARRMVGVSDDRASDTLQFTDYVPLQWQDFLVQTVLATARERGLWEGEMQLRHMQTGALVDVFRSTFLLRDRAGQPSSFATVTRDITQAKHAEAALRESREALRLTLDAAKIGHWDLDLVTHEATRSEQHDQVFGYPKLLPNWSYETFLDHVFPADRAHVDRLFHAGVATNSHWDFECRIIRHDGVLRWIWAHGNVFSDAAGQAVRMLGMVSDITERKNAEARAVWLASFPERNPSPIVEIDPVSGELNYANPAALHKYPDLQREGFGHPLLADLDGLRARLGEQGTLRRELGVGSAFFSQLVTYIADSGRVRIYSTDITERRNAEQALREREAQLHAADRRLAEIVQGMTEACFALDAEWRFSFVNDRVQTLLRQNREQMLGRSIWEVFHWLVGTSTETHYRRAMSERVPVAFEVYSTVAERWLDIRLFPTSEGLAAFLLDIQARKIAELEREKFVSLAENSDEFIGMRDLQGVPIFVNEAALRLVGLDNLEQAVGTPPAHFFFPEDQAFVRDEFVPRVLRDGHGETEIRFRHFKTGEAIWMIYNAFVLRDPHGEPSALATVSRNITDRKRAEQEIRKLNSDLERRVSERTGELEAANKELEAFSYSVSHDLRSPLRTVHGFSRILLDDYGAQLPDEAREHLQTICDGAQRMHALIDDLLGFSRFSRLPLLKRTVDTQQLVEDTLSQLQAEHGERALEIRLGELPSCEGDPALLKQVWLNLLSNAFKYTKNRAQAVLEIGATRERGRTAYFVRDNGTGFDMRHAGKLFGVFQRLHRQDEFEGTGVGLAIVQRIVQRHGGRIWADAAVDRGATFYFTLEADAAESS